MTFNKAMHFGTSWDVGGGGGGTVLFDTKAKSNLSASGTSTTISGASVGSPGTWNTDTGVLDVGSGSNGTTDRALVVVLCFSESASGTASSPSCTWNGDALTSIGGPYTHTGNGDIWLFGMVAPDTGEHSFAASWTGTTKVQVYVLSVVTALQTGGSSTFHGVTSATGNGISASVTIASALSNEMSFAAYLCGTSLGATSHTLIGLDNASASISSDAAQYGSGVSPALAIVLTSSNWVAAGVAIAGA